MQNLELIGLIVISWLLIWWYEKGNLSVLGLAPTGKRLQSAGLLFLITALCCATGFLLRMYFVQEQFVLNPGANLALILTGIWLNFKSVLFEELLCRGVGLYVLIQKLGQKWAILISAFIFGLLHVLNPEALSHPVQGLMTLGSTFIMGLLLAYAFARSKSLYLPFAIHFGWNLTQNFIFPDGPFGNQLLISAAQPEVTVSYFVYFVMILFPKVSAIGLDYWMLTKMDGKG